MRFPKRTAAERLTIAHLTGMVENLAVGAGKQVDQNRAVAALHRISRDPLLLGDILGVYLARTEEDPSYATAVQLLRWAGADEQTAQAMLEWQHERRQRQIPTGFDVPGEQG